MLSMTPCLWFERNAEEAAQYYAAIFPSTEIVETRRSPGSDTHQGPGPAGGVLSVTFRLLGREIMALNGGVAFPYTPAISFFVACDSQAEVDRLWGALTKDGAEGQCGWCTDKYGVSWQVVPKRLGALLQDADRARAKRAMAAMLAMKKLDVATLERAAGAA